MLRATIVGVTALTLVAVPVAGADLREAAILEPTSKWVVDLGETDCKASRIFGTGDEAIRLDLFAFTSLANLSVEIAGKTIPRVRAGDAKLTGAALAPFATIYGLAESKDGPFGLSANLAGGSLPSAPDGTLRVSIKDKPIINLHVGKMTAAWQALQTCVRDNFKRWGIDAAAFDQVAVWPEPASNPSSWFVSSDLPASLVKGGGEGRAIVRLDILPEGKVAKCSLLASSGAQAFDQESCASLKVHGRFSPGRDAHGKAIAAIWITRTQFWAPKA